MKHGDIEIKLVYQKLGGILACLSAIALTLQLLDANQWASLIPAKVKAGEIWRLLSAHFIHINWHHYIMNMLGAALCMTVFRYDVNARHWVISAVLISLFSSLCLYAYYTPWQSYVGFSDVLHGWIVMGVLAMLVKEPKLALVMLTALAGKLLYENFYEAPSAELLEGSRVATESHIFGALGGLFYSLSYNSELRHFLLSFMQKKSG